MDLTDPYRPQPLARWFWVAVIASLLWMAAGCANYLYQVTLDPRTLPLDQRAIVEAAPTWMYAAFAIAVWVGFAGSIFLAMRRKLAEPLLLASLVAVIVQFSAYVLDPQLRQAVSSDHLLVPIIIIAMGWTIFFFARHSRMRGWLR